LKAPPRVVLDTNVVLAALVFGGEAMARIRAGWQSERFLPLASTPTVQELVRALTYPKFRLTATEQTELLADYLPWVRVVEIPDPPPLVPRCRDPFDKPFLQLAVVGKARALVSGDQDLLVLDGASGICPIVTVDAFRARYLGD